MLLAERANVLLTHRLNISCFVWIKSFRSQKPAWKYSCLWFSLLFCGWHPVTPVPFIQSELQVSYSTTCPSERAVFKAVSPQHKELHVNKNKTSILHSHNAAPPPIPCSLSLTTSHPLRVNRPSFMFKDYLLIQNVQEHETEAKGPILRGEGGMAWLYLFIGFHINPLEHIFPLFSGHVWMF